MYSVFRTVLLYLLLGPQLYSQSHGFIAYSVSDGLAQSNVTDIAEDHLGNLWLATAGGISKFNGIEFVTYKKEDGLSSNRVYCVTACQDKIWIGTNAGISIYDGREFQSVEVPFLASEHWVSSITSDQYGNIWFTTSSGSAAYISNDTGSPVLVPLPKPLPGKVSGITENNGTIWIATDKEGVYNYTNDNLEKAPAEEGLEKAIVTSIFTSDIGEVWLGTSIGLFRWNEELFELSYAFDTHLGELNIYSIAEEEPGTVWLGTNKGALRIGAGIYRSIGSSDGLTDNIVYKIHRDREGTLWFGTFGGGLIKSTGVLFTKFGKKEGISNDYISSITRDFQQNYWFGTYGGGVYQLTMPSSATGAKVVKSYNYEHGLTNDYVRALEHDDQQNLWIATDSGLNKFTRGSIEGYYKEHGLPSNQIHDVLKSRDGSVYCGTSWGLSKVPLKNGNQFVNFLYPGDDVHNQVRDLFQTRSGEILLATLGGLKTFDGQTIADYYQDDSLKYLPVSSIYEDEQGYIWSALVDNGVLCYDPKNKNAFHITEEQGLSSNIVYSLVQDSQGSLWVGAPDGLDKIMFNTSGGIEQIRHFGANEGFSGVETIPNAVYEEPDGAIWFGTVAGAFKCLPGLDRKNGLEPITRITGVRLFSENVEWVESAEDQYGWYRIPSELKLSHNQNHLTFDFFGTSLKNPNKVRYRFRLKNFDSDWRAITNKNEAVYASLPPGAYTFEVMASNSDGVWNTQPSVLQIVITPPFWENWWFFLAAMLVLGVTGRLYYKSRVQAKLNDLMLVEKLKNEEIIKVKRQVAEDFHDQVGNQLASITVLVQLIQAKLDTGNKEVEDLLQKLGQFTKMLFTGTRDFIWSIDPRSDKVNEMLIYIRDFGEELFEYTDINFHVETNDSFSADSELPIGWSRHIVYIFKEALSNSLKHTGCKNVYLNFNVSDHNYVFELKDDGKGLNGYNDEGFVGMGLRNMKERAQKIGGEIIISSDENTGTRIVLAGKIPQNEG